MLCLFLPLHRRLLCHNVEAIEVRDIVVYAHLVQLTVVLDCILQFLFHLVLLGIFLHFEH